MEMVIRCAQATPAAPDVWAVSSTVGAAILGALVAGVAGYFAARFTASEARGLATTQLLETERTSAIRAMLRLFSLTNSLAGYDAQISGMLEVGEAELGPEHPWRYVLGISGGEHERIQFGADDLIAFVKARETTFVSELIMLAGRFAPLASNFSTYSARRDNFLSRLKADKVEGNQGSGGLTDDEMQWAGPMMADLDFLIVQLRAHTTALLQDAKGLCQKFGPIAQKYFNDPTFPTLSIGGGAGDPTATGKVATVSPNAADFPFTQPGASVPGVG